MNEGSQTITLGYTETHCYQCDLELLVLPAPSPKCSDCRDSRMLGRQVLLQTELYSQLDFSCDLDPHSMIGSVQ